jgi:hypothetical protein
MEVQPPRFVEVVSVDEVNRGWRREGWLRELGIKPVALGVTQDGHPKHPLHVPYGTEVVAFAEMKS